MKLLPRYLNSWTFHDKKKKHSNFTMIFEKFNPIITKTVFAKILCFSRDFFFKTWFKGTQKDDCLKRNGPSIIFGVITGES